MKSFQHLFLAIPVGFSISSVKHFGIANAIIKRSTNQITKQLSFKKFAGNYYFERKMSKSASSAMPQISSNTFINNKDQNPNSTVLQYKQGEERFRLKITLRNGKVFNFDRAVSETANSIKERITTNVSKKIKNFAGTVKLLVYNQEVSDETMESILEKGLNDFSVLKIQIGDDVYEVEFNPPEILQMKFLKTAMSDFPIFPYKIETTNNFILAESKFKWEFSKEKKLSSNVANKKSKQLVEEKSQLTTGAMNQTETDRNSSQLSKFVLIPNENMVGNYLRFTCTPSDGHRFGIPLTIETPTPISNPVASTLVFNERLSRLDPKDTNNPNYVRVISYNTLADTYATPEWFSFSPALSLEIDYRLPLLNKELFSYDGDIVCLQEVDSKYYEGNYEPFFAMHCNHQGVFSSKIGNTKEGVATFFNRDKFSLISSNTIVILEHMKSLPMWKSVFCKNAALIKRLEDRNTVFQVNIVESKVNPNLILVVANTHLYFHPDADHIRLIQTITCVDYLQSTIKRLTAAHPNKTISLIFCGDFNCTPPFSSFRLLTTGKLDKYDDDWISHETELLSPGLEFQHDLALTNSHPGEELTNITMQFEGCIDYILYQAHNTKLVKTYPPPDKSILAEITETSPPKVSLPNFKTPSDHLPLIADFLLPC